MNRCKNPIRFKFPFEKNKEKRCLHDERMRPSMILNFCWTLNHRDGQCFHGNKTEFPKIKITDDQTFNMLIFRIVRVFFCCHSLFAMSCRYFSPVFIHCSDINVMYLRHGLTNDNGELHPNGVNVWTTKRKITLNMSFVFAALPTINRVSFSVFHQYLSIIMRLHRPTHAWSNVFVCFGH